MRAAVVALVATVLVLTGQSADAADRHRNKRPCVARAEVDGVQRHVGGWTRARVERYFETADVGKLQSSGPFLYSFVYPSCSAGRQVIAYFHTDHDDLVGIKVVRGVAVSYPPGL
jgi:hypothetical protein